MADLASLSLAELIDLIQAQQQQIAELLRENEQLKRQGKRQAAPFSKGKPVTNPKRPGRKPGQGRFLYRSAPPDPPTETILATTPRCCPDCGGELDQEREETATTTNLPIPPKPVVTAYRVPVCRCRQCGKTVRGSAPGLVPDQVGATAHRVGDRVMAAAHMLHYAVGIPVRKVPSVLRELTGVCLTQGAMTQDALRRMKGPVGAEYQRLRAQVREAAAVHTDDTGWRVGGRAAHRMGFDTDAVTVYQIRDRHRNEEVRELIPGDYKGVLISDRGKSYDAEAFLGVAKQKCVSHLLRNVSEVLENKRGPARRFGLKLKGLLRSGLTLWHARGTLGEDEYRKRSEPLEEQVTDHLRLRVLKDDGNQKLLDGIGLQHDYGSLLRFLSTEGVEPTNNRAERILRPAVIARKVSHCSKNQRGAEAFAAFLSVVQTARKQAGNTVSRVLLNLFARPVAEPGR
jgi:transposase